MTPEVAGRGGPNTGGMPSLGRVRTVAAHDELRHEGESLVLLDGQVRRISPIGTVIRDRATQGASVEELATVLEDLFGAPGDGDALGLTRAAVQTMLAEGLLEDVADGLLEDPAG